MSIREQYMLELEGLLKEVPAQLRQEWLYDYYNHFEQANKNGQTEAEAAMELGDPRTIAYELLLGFRVEQAERSKSFAKLSKAVFATMGIGFFNVIFVLVPYIALCALLLALWMTAVALAAGSIIVTIDSVNSGAFTLQQALSLGLIGLGLAMLLAVWLFKLTRKFFAVTLKYLKYNRKLMRGNQA
ncbi:HAAS signaling domain-containing protein [Paenibacillus sp. NPDC058071]|uniref:HAAS signaling domain-containing protein n=1 Tax=Paenibacillus sp. NPDC058071 TaxID=3346326 RepID=UPI0036DBB80A